jgi:prepilin-type N-terminal cleavage/methylation domain-containing protein
MNPHGQVRRARVSRDTMERSLARGFSLIELLIVLAIILILTTMYWGFSSRSYQQTQQKKCRANLQKIYIALQIYATEHKKFPVVAGATFAETPLDLLVPRYTADTSTFTCPGSKDSPLPSGRSLTNGQISYAYFMGRTAADETLPLLSDKLTDTTAKSAGANAFSTDGKAPGNNHHKYGGNFLFGDGRTEFSPARLAFPLPATPGVVVLNPKP